MGPLFDFTDGDMCMGMGGGMLMDSEGNMMQRMGGNMAMDMQTGEMHFISGDGCDADPFDDEDDW